MAEGADHPTVVFALEAGVDAVVDSNELSQHDHLSRRRRLVSLLVAAMAVIGIVGCSSDESSQSSEQESPTSGCGSSISREDAETHIGEVATVEGPVVSTYCAAESSGQPTFLNIGRDHPDPERVTALIWGDDRSRFPGAPEQTYRGHRVCVTGRLELYEGVAEIIVSSPDEIQRAA